MPQASALALPYASSRRAALARVSIAGLGGGGEMALVDAVAEGLEPVRIATMLIGVCAHDAAGPLGPARAAALSLGDREVALRAIHAETFGAVALLSIACPGCGALAECALDVTTLTAAPRSAEGETITGRAPTGADLEAASGGRDLLARCGLRDEADLAYCDPNAECALNLTCPACCGDFTALLDALTLLMDAAGDGGGIYADIDRLAREYGWDEAAILALPRGRRRRYCDRIAAAAGGSVARGGAA